MGDQGKTTLAKMVYNTDTVIGMFPKRMWVTVPDDFDFRKIYDKMVVSLTLTASAVENIEGLINDLQKNVKGRMFLLVLDKWDNLMDSLLGFGSERGSNVLVTTREKEVISSEHDSVVSISYLVEKPADDDIWALFRNKHSHVEELWRLRHLRPWGEEWWKGVDVRL